MISEVFNINVSIQDCQEPAREVWRIHNGQEQGYEFRAQKRMDSARFDEKSQDIQLNQINTL